MKILLLYFLVISNILFAQNDSKKSSHKRGKANSEKEMYVTMEGVASFPGGDSAFKKFLNHNLQRIADSALVHGIKKGTYDIALNFMIDIEGNVKTTDAQSDPHEAFLENACKAMIEKSPRWTPSIVSGRPVKTNKFQILTIVVQ